MQKRNLNCGSFMAANTREIPHGDSFTYLSVSTMELSEEQESFRISVSTFLVKIGLKVFVSHPEMWL